MISVFTALTIGFTGLASPAGPVPVGPDDPGPAVLEVTLSGLHPCWGHCHWCGYGDHEYSVKQVEGEYSDDWSHGCRSGGCGLHYPCEWDEEDGDAPMVENPEFSEDAEALRLALVSLDGPAIRKLVRKNKDFVYVPERTALQLIGCTGKVIVHIPLNLAQVAAVEEQ